MADWTNLPTVGSSSSGRKTIKYFGTTYGSAGGGGKLTASQLLAIQSAKHKGHSQSFGDMIKSAGKGSLHTVAWTFDKILRPSYALTAAISAEKKAQRQGEGWGGQFTSGWHGFVRGIEGKEKKGYGQVLQESGVLKGHRRLRGGLGFALDVGLDPLTYLTGGTTILAKSAEHAAAIAAGRRAIRGAANDVLKSNKVELGHVFDTQIKDVANLAKAGPNYAERHALAKAQLSHLVNGTDAQEAEYRFLHTAATQEEKRVEKFIPNIGVGKLRTPTTLGASARAGGGTIVRGKQLLPALPKIANVPGKAAQAFRDAFITDRGMSTTTHAFQTQAKHLAERQLDQLHANVALKLQKAAKTISNKRQLEVVHPFEAPDKGFKAVVKGADGNFQINEKYAQHLIDQGRITSKELDFVKALFDSNEYLFKNEKDFGALTKHYSGSGRMYVPHVLTRKDELGLTDAEASAYAAGKLTTMAGFERGRTKAVSLKMLADASVPGVETDLNLAMANRISSSAKRVSELAHLNALKTIGGISKTLVDAEKLGKNQVAKQAAIDNFNALEKLHNSHLEKAHNAEQKALLAHEVQHELDMATLTDKKATNAAIAKRQRQHVDEVLKIHKGTFFPTDAKQRALFEKSAGHATDAAKTHSQMADLADEVRKLVAEEKKILKGKANPAYKAAVHTTTSAKDIYGNDIAFANKELAQAVDKIRNVMSGDAKSIQAFDSFYRKGLSKWKLAVTSINPGYRMRNSATDMWNWWLKPGVNAYTAAKYLTQGTLLMKRLKNIEKAIIKQGGTKTPQQLADLRTYKDMYDHGVLSGLFKGDIQRVAQYLKFEKNKTELLKSGHALAMFEKAAQDVNRNGENWIRIAHYLWAKDRGLSAGEAADSVKSAHFDYEHLTEFEQRRMKLVAPFYTWTRKNVPYQIKAMAQAPGKYAAFPKAVNESEYAAGGDKGNILPGYIPQNFGFQIPLGKHNYLLPQLGVSDLAALDSPTGLLNKAEQLVTPAIKTPFELAVNKSLFTNAPITSDTHKLAPTSAGMRTILNLLPGKYGETGTTSRIGAGGKHVSSPGVNAKALYVAKQFGPLATLISKWGAPSTKINPLVSYGLGLSISHVDPAQQQLLAQIQLTADAKKSLQTLRDEGSTPQAKRKVSALAKRRQDKINQMMGRR